MNTLLLDRTRWDLVTDTSGNIAMASNPYALAQDAASAVRTFAGEPWYDASIGIPYFQSILGQRLSLQFFKTKIVAAARAVPDVASAVCYVTKLANRRLEGQVHVTDALGQTAVSYFHQ